MPASYYYVFNGVTKLTSLWNTIDMEVLRKQRKTPTFAFLQVWTWKIMRIILSEIGKNSDVPCTFLYNAILSDSFNTQLSCSDTSFYSVINITTASHTHSLFEHDWRTQESYSLYCSSLLMTCFVYLINSTYLTRAILLFLFLFYIVTSIIKV